MRKRIVFLMLAILIFASCSKNNQEEVKKLSIKTVTVQEESAAPTISAFGNVIYRAKSDIYPTSSSTIAKILVEKGDFVKKSDILALLDDTKLQIQLRQAEADVTSKKALVELAKAQLDDGIRSAKKSCLTISKLRLIAEQKEREYQNMLRIYNNKLKLHEIGGMSDEELKTVTLNMENAKNALDQTLVELDSAKIDFTDEDDWIKINTQTLRAELESAKAELEAAEAQVENLKVYIEESKIKSPVDGIIAERYVNIGEKADLNSQLFTIFSTEIIYVEAEINAHDFEQIKIGNTAVVHIGKMTRNGEVAIVSPYVDAKTGSRSVKVSIANDDLKLLPGEFSEISIETGKKENHLFVPKSALIYKNEDYSDTRLFLIRKNFAFQIPVEVEFIQDGKAYIKGNIAQGDLIATSKLEHLSDGMEVEIR